MSEAALKALSDMASDAHARIQQTHETLNPVVGVRRGMRDIGIPADVMTLDCLRSNRRILIVLHDEDPGALIYQFTTTEEEAGTDFKRMALAEVATDTLFNWMQDYFLSNTN